MPSFPPIQSVLDKARCFRQAGTYLTGKDRKRFEAKYLPNYLEWATYLFQLGHWTESRCLFQEIRLITALKPPFDAIWGFLEQERRGEITNLEPRKEFSTNNIQTLRFVQILIDGKDIKQALEEFKSLDDSLKNSMAGKLIEMKINDKAKDLSLLRPLLDSAIYETKEYEQSIFILVHQYLEALQVVKYLELESASIEKNIKNKYKNIVSLRDLINLPFPDTSFQKIRHKIHRAGTIAKDFGTHKDQVIISKLISEFEKNQKELPIANRTPRIEIDTFREVVSRRFFAAYEHTNQTKENSDTYKKRHHIKELLVKLRANQALYLPLLLWEINYEYEFMKYSHLKHLEMLLEQDDFLQWWQHQEAFRQSSKIKIFISYSTIDSIIMKKIVQGLEAYGFHIILDINELKLRQNIGTTLDIHLKNVDHTILLVSQHSLSSEWAVEESAFSLMIDRVESESEADKGKRLIPIVVDRLARINFQFFGDQITLNILNKQEKIKESRKFRKKIKQEISDDIYEMKGRLKKLKDNYHIILDMIKSDFALDFYNDEKISENMPKLVQRILEFNQESLTKSEMASTSL